MNNVIIFGANRGIGLALTKRYLDNGDKVWALCRRSSEELKETEATIVEGCEVTDLKSLKDIVKSLSSESFDILIHNAGIWADENLFDASEEDFENMARAFEVNSIAPLKVISAFHHLLSDGAKVGVMSSRMGSVEDNSSGGRYAYRMSKAALNIAGKSLSIDLPNHPVAVLHPGYVRTDMTGGNGMINTDESANGLFAVMKNLSLSETGKFWHSNGEVLPW